MICGILSDNGSIFIQKLTESDRRIQLDWQATWKFERTRKDVQEHLSAEYKNILSIQGILLKPFSSLVNVDKQAVNIMLYESPTLSSAHFYKEEFQKIIKVKNIPNTKDLCMKTSC